MIGMDLSLGWGDYVEQEGVSTMGDKSPKSKEKSRKQDVADKNQKRAAVVAKASLSAAVGKKTK
jgi:hypothetical protein